jgi:hypothetical protein
VSLVKRRSYRRSSANVNSVLLHVFQFPQNNSRYYTRTVAISIVANVVFRVHGVPSYCSLLGIADDPLALNVCRPHGAQYLCESLFHENIWIL